MKQLPPIPERAAAIDALNANPRQVERRFLVRLVLLIVAIMALVFYYANLPSYYHYLVTHSEQALGSLNWGPVELHQAVEQAGIPAQVMALVSTILFGLLTAIYASVAFFILLRKPNEQVTTLTALTLVFFGTGFPPVFDVAAIYRPELNLVFDFWSEAGFSSLFILYLIFPDGRFRPRWTVWLAVLWGLQPVLLVLWPASPLLLYALPQPWGSLAPLAGLGLFATALIYRYYKLFNPIQRQQTKWAVLGMGTALLIFSIFLAYYYSHPELHDPQGPATIRFHLLTMLLTVLFTTIPVSLGIAITRHRLWEIDLIIRRTVTYSLVTASLLVVFFGSIILLQIALSRFTQIQNSQISTVLSTLIIAALFNPLRRRIQRNIDRQFYRRKTDAMQAISTFALRTQSQVDLSALKDGLSQVVRETMQPQHLSIWFQNPTQNSRKDRAGSFRNDLKTPVG